MICETSCYIIEDSGYLWGIAKTPEGVETVLAKTGIEVPDIQEIMRTIEEDGRWDDKYTAVSVRKGQWVKAITINTIEIYP